MVLKARTTFDNLSEEVRKGNARKLSKALADDGATGIATSSARKRQTGDRGRSGYAAGVTKLFEWFSTALYSLREAAKRARAEGMTFRRSEISIRTSSVHKFCVSDLHRRVEWLGKRYQGSHEPRSPGELWDASRGSGWPSHPAQSACGKGLPVPGMIKCGHCGCLLVGTSEAEIHSLPL